jgi:hypothetical protein
MQLMGIYEIPYMAVLFPNRKFNPKPGGLGDRFIIREYLICSHENYWKCKDNPSGGIGKRTNYFLLPNISET